MSNYNLDRGKTLFNKKIAELLPKVDAAKRPVIQELAARFVDRVGVMPEGELEPYLIDNLIRAKDTTKLYSESELAEIKELAEQYVPSYAKLASSVVGAVETGRTDLDELATLAIKIYGDGGCSEHMTKKNALPPTPEQLMSHKVAFEEAHAEIDQYSIKKKTWTEIVIVRDEEGNVLLDENGNAVTEEIVCSNATMAYSEDEEGNLVESEIVLDDIDLMKDMDDEDLTDEGKRSAGIISPNFDTLSGQNADDQIIGARPEKLPLGQIRATEDGGWEIVCPFTGSTTVYQISSNVYASVETDQPFRIDASLSDLRE